MFYDFYFNQWQQNAVNILSFIYVPQFCLWWPKWRSLYSESLRAGLSWTGSSLGVRLFVPIHNGPEAQLTSYIMGAGILL
jgi:hypothetical protein